MPGHRKTGTYYAAHRKQEPQRPASTRQHHET
jgi:hypothetical protein